LSFQARIKKIMQKDEEVGKVAQATPVVICSFIFQCCCCSNPVVHPAKALELFLAMIIDESSKVTLERGSKKVESYHLCAFLTLHFPPTRTNFLIESMR
jgi:hypothetical protein